MSNKQQLNRPIEFRAWSRKYKSFTYFNMKNLNDEDFRFTNWDDLSITQYTGIKDRDGKKVFEGDVVKHNGIVSKVIFENGSFKWKNERRNLKGYLGQRMEVIGNVFEDPSVDNS